jgi:predicted metal-binding membrane protein
MALHSNVAEGALLIAAGVYQLSPVKSACIRQCRSPAQFLTQHWRPGMHGAVRLGISHGAYCLGCCWMLMTLLFVGGIMNVLWIAGLTLLVAAEKLLSRGDLLRLASAIALLLWGFGRLWLSA